MILNLFPNIKILLLNINVIFILLGSHCGLFAQTTPMPGLNKSNYTNSVSSEKSGIILFKFSTGSRSLTYGYSLKNGSSFNGIKVSTGGYTFFPSYFGGVSAISPVTNIRYYMWSEEIKKKLLGSRVSGDTLIAEWVIYKESEFYFHYEYKISIKGMTLIIRVKDLGKIKNHPINNYAYASFFQLDRCEDAVEPVNISIPYLTTFNILYTNNLFTSIFFDWTKTNASQIYPVTGKFSNSSVYYSQTAYYKKKTNGKYNKLDETIYLTVSPDLDEVLPNIPNPVSEFKSASVNHLVYDNWDKGFNKIISDTKTLKQNGIDSLWLIVHDWQNGGYDNKLPDVLPSNSLYGGNTALKELSALCRSYKYLFSLHENYSDFYPNAKSYKTEHIALDSKGEYIKAWKTSEVQSHLLKPVKVNDYLNSISSKIKKTFSTNASFVDVMAARNPSDYVDYDYESSYAGKFKGTYTYYKNAAKQLRKIHKGPVSSEGYNHFLYVGYYDDITAQILDAEFNKNPAIGGYYRPLLVNFDLLKMHNKSMVHGVGYLERFFSKNNIWQSHMGRSKDSILICSATELAYGHGGFIQSNSYDYLEQAKIEYEFVYPMQLLYGNANVKKILYNDDGNLISVSDYIKKYPLVFNDIQSDKFLSQVYIEYDNGVKIYVNRNNFKEWQIFLNNSNGWYNYNAVVNGTALLKTDTQSPGNVILPKSNGWLCYSTYKPLY